MTPRAQDGGRPFADATPDDGASSPGSTDAPRQVADTPSGPAEAPHQVADTPSGTAEAPRQTADAPPVTPAPDPQSLLEAHGLHAYYGMSHVLHGVDFRIARGETVGLMGRNGMGKTTLLKAMLGLVKPRGGDVWVRGAWMTGAEPHRIARQGIAYVPEGRGIFPNLTVRENLVMAARPGLDGRHAWTYERVLETFPRLAQRLGTGGDRLSGGEQQMLTIGRALMTNPDLLILDEATEGLAPHIAREIWRIVRAIRADGIATVLVDKNYAAVGAIADRSVILVKGRVVFEGESRALLADRAFLHRHLGV